MSALTDLPDLFPGFAEQCVAVGNGQKIYLRTGGAGPPLICLHGYPQTHVCWHRLASNLSQSFTLILPDLPGYGRSSAPETDAKHTPYSKRAMAARLTEAMSALGHERFAVLSHDRGARVGYRLALDAAERVNALITLDIVPTESAWRDMDDRSASGKFHWSFLDRPAPLPETMIAASADSWHEYLLASWTGSDDLSPFSDEAMQHYRANWSNPSAIKAMCEDYRAGSSTDREIDSADLETGTKITCPTLALWGDTRSVGSVGKGSVLDVWRAWCTDVDGAPVKSGHFIPEEAPEEALRLIEPFLRHHLLENMDAS